MPNQNSFDSNAQNNADGGQIGMGFTFSRLFKWIGADVTIRGNGSAVVTFPTGTATLLSTQLNEFSTLFGNVVANPTDQALVEDSLSGFAKGYISLSQIFSDPVLVSSTYSPTATTGTNIKGIQLGGFRFWKIGDLVLVFGSVALSVTTSGSLANVFFSLPVASNFNLSQDVLGFANQVANVVANPGMVFGSTGTSTAEYQWVPSFTTLLTYRIFFGYVIK